MVDGSQTALCVAAVEAHGLQFGLPARIVVHQPLVVLADAQLAEEGFGDERAGGLHEVVELQAFGVLDGLAVDIYLSFFNLERVARQAHAALHVVLAAVNRAGDDLAIHLRVGQDEVASCCIVEVVDGPLLLARQAVHVDLLRIDALPFAVGQAVEVGLLEVGGHGVARGEVEHHDVVQLHPSEARHALVLPLRPLDVRLAVEDGQCVLGQRHGERRVGHARSVAHLAHVEEIAHKQRFLQRRRRYLIVLEEVDVDEVNGHQGEHDGVHPAHDAAHGSVLGLPPPAPGYLLGDVDVIDERHDHQSPPAPDPQEEEQVE